MADGIYYVDTRQQFTIADLSAITLSTTQKMLWTPGATSPTLLPANYWYVGKLVRLTAFIKLVQDATAGNYVFGMAYGAADAPACNVVTTARAGVSGGAITCGSFWQGYAQCRSVGTSGTLSMWGNVTCDLTGMLSTVQPNVFPVGGTTVVSTIDTTVGTNGLYFQGQRSGAGVWTATTVGLCMEAMN
jgi:hypothetical protein